MADVAQLGLQVDSSQVNSATAALNKLNAASASAAQGADKLASSGAKSETVMRAIERRGEAGWHFHRRDGKADRCQLAMRLNQAGLAQQPPPRGDGQPFRADQANANDNENLRESTDKTNSSLDRLANTLTRRVLFAFAAKEVRDLAGMSGT
jgi:hypothetical protein